MTVRKHSRSLPMMQARANVTSVNEERRTVEVVWSTGARVLRPRFLDEPFYEELSMEPSAIRMERMNSGSLPMLSAHNSMELSSVLGVVESASISNGEGRATVRFSEREDVEPIWQDVRNGILVNVSVGYRVYRYRDVTESDDDHQVLRAIDWEPFEISSVPVGADDTAGVRSDKRDANEVVIEEPGGDDGQQGTAGAAGTRADDDQSQQGGSESMRYDSEGNPIPGSENEGERAAGTGEQAGGQGGGESREEIRRAEQERQTAIRSRVRTAGLGEDVAEQLVEQGISPATASERILERLAENQPRVDGSHGARVAVGADESDKFRTQATDAVLFRAGLKKEDPANDMRGFGLLDHARACLEQAGVRTARMSKEALARAAITHSTSDFSNIFENAMHKTLLESYAGVDVKWTQFCATGDLSDFRPHIRYRQGSFPRLQGLDENGELKHTTMPDAERESIAADENGLIFTLSYKMIVNDDLGAFLNTAQNLGRSAAISVEEDVFKLLLANPAMSDGKALFHADHNNLAGTGGAPSVDTLGKARQAMRKQKDPGGNSYVMLNPSILVTPVAVEDEAWQVINSPTDPSKTNSRVRNRENDRWTLLSSPYLDESDASAWYAFASPMQAPALEVGFVGGQREPSVETEESFDSRGIKYRVTHDYGVAERDYRPAYKNPGQ